MYSNKTVTKQINYLSTFKLPRKRNIFCLLNEHKVFGWKWQINPGTTRTDPVETLKETGARVLKSTQHKRSYGVEKAVSSRENE